MTSLCVVMPAYNEAEGISSFINELSEALKDHPTHFIVVDDCSTDGTPTVIDQLASRGIPIQVHTNPQNSGHGPSTMRALRFGLESGADVVIAVDGDGQFAGADVARAVNEITKGPWDLIEGVRTKRTDPLYRKIPTLGTRLLVWSKARQLPRDANTPLRLYKRQTLSELIELIPPTALTPNLLMSVHSRNCDVQLLEIPVQSLPRRGTTAVGSSWGRGSLVPSRRFINFCIQALREWH